MAEKNVIWDIELEVKALKTVLTDNSYSEKLYGFLKPEHFHYKATKALFTRLQEVMEKQTGFPSWRMLVTDSKLEQSVQAALQDQFQNSTEASTVGDLDYITRHLGELANKRALYATIFETQESLFDPEKSAQDIAGEVGTAILKIENEDLVAELNMGKEYNEVAERIFNDVVYNPHATNFVKTGYKSFDARSGGHQRGNLVCIGATSGGGKSVMALNLMTRQYLMGYDVVMASYEMNFHEILNRELAMLSEVAMEKITRQELSAHEKIQIECSWREFNLFGKKNGNTFSIACPTSSTTVSEVGLKYKSRRPTSIIFDYINLLHSKAKHTDAQWQMLGEIAKEAKILATRMDCVVYLLIQIDEEHNLRYSKAIKDHANWVMGWVYNEEAKANGFVNVKQIKARNAPTYDFQLVTRFDISQFRDPDEEDKVKIYTEADLRALSEESERLGAMIDLNPRPALKVVGGAPVPLKLVEAEVQRTTPPRSYL